MENLSNIITESVFILLHFFVFLFTYLRLHKKLLHPAVLFSFVWFGIVFLHLIFKFTLLKELEPLNISTYLIFLFGSIFFSVGGILADLPNRRFAIPFNETGKPEPVGIKFRLLFLSIAIIGLPLYIQAAFQVFLASKAEDFFTGLRYELSYGDSDIGPVKYFMPLAYVVFTLNLYAFYLKRNKVNRIILIISFLVLTTFAVFATGRTYFFMILTTYLGISFMVNPRFSMKKYATAIIGFLLFFMVFGVIYGKGGNTNDNTKDNIQAATENVGIYMVTSLNALDQETTSHPMAPVYGDNTLRFFYKIGMQLHIVPNRKIKDLIQEFVFVPYPTNVYTFYSPYIRDFGKLYAWLMLFIFSALHTFFYNKASQTKKMRFVFYYTFLLFPLILSFFGDQYLSLFSFWLQMIFFTELLIVINRYFNLKKW